MRDHKHVIPHVGGMELNAAPNGIRFFGELAEGRLVEDSMDRYSAVINCCASARDCLTDEGWADIVHRLLDDRRDRE